MRSGGPRNEREGGKREREGGRQMMKMMLSQSVSQPGAPAGSPYLNSLARRAEEEDEEELSHPENAGPRGGTGREEEREI